MNVYVCKLKGISVKILENRLIHLILVSVHSTSLSHY